MIRKATLQDANEVAELALLLWPDHTGEELREEMEQILTQSDAAIFLALHDGQPVGFAQCQLRHDYVEGTSSSPVGYLEGLFVKEKFREQGIAKKLITMCEKWAKHKGCQEFASDCELDNEGSLAMHLKLGFQEANRIVCFTKSLGDSGVLSP
ncbi:N-acetyltransferase [Sporosarcina sp. NCCP-2716]|uniref:aminoglycoside 6'-N-acetyltransferase n=1 Tax=Sporosarcina sp. NCCP-2716 TaxID=2943679 RepID=UPI00204189CD|nr:aminoglycoside 6'-N-acetyltransferase [Sporosarcina sp. NCCP-2716]GKV68658.1 N-acetyltransferase [Sporosarcina sp. NCCP-2716]